MLAVADLTRHHETGQLLNEVIECTMSAWHSGAIGEYGWLMTHPQNMISKYVATIPHFRNRTIARAAAVPGSAYHVWRTAWIAYRLPERRRIRSQY
jgi:hypothetical protein